MTLRSEVTSTYEDSKMRLNYIYKHQKWRNLESMHVNEKVKRTFILQRCHDS